MVIFALALRCAGARDVWRWTALVTATPLVAFPLAVAGDDLPVLALMCLGFALLWRPGRPNGPVLAGVALGVAAGLKATAWLAVVVALALLAARDGRRAVAGFALTTLAVLAVLVGPVAAVAPTALVDNTVSFPLGLSHVKSGALALLDYSAAQTGHPALIAVGLLVLRPGRGPVAGQQAAEELPLRHLAAHHRLGADVQPGAGQPVRLLHLPGRPVGVDAGVKPGRSRRGGRARPAGARVTRAHRRGRKADSRLMRPGYG